MEKDYIPSSKYTQEEIDEVQIPYSLNDSCVDALVEYRSCNMNNKWNFMPFFYRVGPCRQLFDRWVICQSNREFEIKEKRRSELKLIEETGKTLERL